MSFNNWIMSFSLIYYFSILFLSPFLSFYYLTSYFTVLSYPFFVLNLSFFWSFRCHFMGFSHTKFPLLPIPKPQTAPIFYIHQSINFSFCSHFADHFPFILFLCPFAFLISWDSGTPGLTFRLEFSALKHHFAVTWLSTSPANPEVNPSILLFSIFSQ